MDRIRGALLGFLRRMLTQVSTGRMESAAAVTVGAVLTLSSLLFFLGSAADFIDRGDDGLILLGLGVMTLLLGILVTQGSRFPDRLTVPRLFGSVAVGAVTLVFVVMLAHLGTGAVGNLDVAFLEASATVTGTNTTTVEPETLGTGILVLRAIGQWASGAALIVIVVRVLPHMAVGGLDADGGVATRSARRLSPRSGATVGRLLLLYGLASAMVGVGYVAAGMPLRDSLLHAATTVSTGGFSTRSGSIGSFGSAAVEWVAIVGMLIGGTSLPLMFLALRRRDPHRFLRSFEFRIYLAIIGLVTLAIIAWADGWPTMASVRHALFAAVSASSTTGFASTDPATFPLGVSSLLLLAAVIGGMSASVSGGFKVVRLMALVAFIRRELRRAIHPTATEALRVGRSSIGEVAVGRIVGELLAALLLVIPASIVLAGGGVDVETSFSLSMSTLSSYGPAFGVAASGASLPSLDAAGHVVAGLMMLLGRIGVVPVLVAVLVLAEPVSRHLRPRERVGEQR